MYFDRNDICEAWFVFFCHYHEGSNSEKYKRLCKMLKYFKPSPTLRVESLSENGKSIYDKLVANHS